MVVDVMRHMRVLIQTSNDAAATMKAVDALLATLLAFAEQFQSPHST